MNKNSFLTRFNKTYPTVLHFLNGFSKIIFTFMKTFLTSIGVLIILVLLLIVEVNRVKLGVAIFETSMVMALFGSTVLVMLNLVIEFVTHYIENEHNYTVPDKYKSSIRLTLKKIGYYVGVGKWEAVKSSPAASFHRLQTLITFAIVVLALGGSMHDEMLVYNELTWYNAVVEIITRSNIETIFKWTGGVLFTFVMVQASRSLSRYIALNALKAELEVFERAKAIKDKEDGKVFLTPQEAKNKFNELYDFNWHINDVLQVAPINRFYDGESEIWSKEYKSKQALMNCMSRIGNRRVNAE